MTTLIGVVAITLMESTEFSYLNLSLSLRFWGRFLVLHGIAGLQIHIFQRRVQWSVIIVHGGSTPWTAILIAFLVLIPIVPLLIFFILYVQLNFSRIIFGLFNSDVALDSFDVGPCVILLPRLFRILPSQELGCLGIETVQ